MHMHTEVAIGGTVTKLSLNGKLDIAGTQAIDLHFSVLVGQNGAIIVDLSQVTFIASMGLRTLILGAKPSPPRADEWSCFRPARMSEKSSRTAARARCCRSIPISTKRLPWPAAGIIGAGRRPLEPWHDGPAVERFDLPCDSPPCSTLAANADRFAATIDLPSGTLFALQLCLEEAVSNVIRYGAPARRRLRRRLAALRCEIGWSSRSPTRHRLRPAAGPRAGAHYAGGRPAWAGAASR